MTKEKILLWIIGISQLVLGGLTLFMPSTFFVMMGLSAPHADNQYMLGMLGARFIAYGIGMITLARQDSASLFWVRNMMLIQVIDFAVGAFYISTGTIDISVAAFPMFNAAIFTLLLGLWFRPNNQKIQAA